VVYYLAIQTPFFPLKIVAYTLNFFIVLSLLTDEMILKGIVAIYENPFCSER